MTRTAPIAPVASETLRGLPGYTLRSFAEVWLEPGQLARMFLLQGLALSSVGAIAGLVAAGVLGRLMSSLLFGVGSLDPLAYVAALAATIAAATLASYLPARQIAAVDPVEALRSE